MKERTKTMKARIKTTGEVKELTQVRQHDWWMDGEGNAAVGNVKFYECTDCVVHAEDERRVVLLRSDNSLFAGGYCHNAVKPAEDFLRHTADKLLIVDNENERSYIELTDAVDILCLFFCIQEYPSSI